MSRKGGKKRRAIIIREHINVFYEGLRNLGICLSDSQINQFIKYYDFILEKNKVMNLTAITDPLEFIEKHFLDSLSIVKGADLSKELRVIDVGTGAGFPGIPLLISYPQLKMTLLDSLNKRILFLNDVIKLLDLKNAYAVHGRSEDLGRDKKYREAYDLCVSRAVANLSVLSEFCIPFVKLQGSFIAYKSGNISEEIKNAGPAVEELGGKIDDIVEFSFGGSKGGEVFDRSLVIIKKTGKTSGKYPRRAGIPAKEPLSQKNIY